jgi:hypothetical protein
MRPNRLNVRCSGWCPTNSDRWLVLQRVLPHAAKSPKAVFSKVALDQLLFAPGCTPIFYGYKVVSEGRPRWAGRGWVGGWMGGGWVGWGWGCGGSREQGEQRG